jgi:hypothetical protein
MNTPEYYYTCHNDDDNMTGIVYASNIGGKGGYAAALRDDDSGKLVGSYHGYPFLQQAIDKAKFLAGVKS